MSLQPLRKPSPQPRQRKPLRSKPHRINDRVRAETLERWGSVCLWCNVPGGALDLHHVQRRSQGGSDSAANLRPLHRLCHSAVHENIGEAVRRGFLIRTGSNP